MTKYLCVGIGQRDYCMLKPCPMQPRGRTMKTKAAIKALVGAIKAALTALLAPYYVQVRGADCTARHYSWTWQGALRWMACYDAGGKNHGSDALRVYKHLLGKPRLIALR